jgi:DNA-directed RNA polymerase subunit beta'
MVNRLSPGAVVARTEIQCKESGEVRGIREGVEAIRRSSGRDEILTACKLDLQGQAP